MTKRKLLVVTALIGVLAIVASACSKSNTPSNSTSGGATPTGGTYRTATQSFVIDDGFDPTGEYVGSNWGLYNQLLLRGLMTYNHKDAEQGGNTPVPDIATAMPQISSDGLTYSFTLKTDVMFGPPVNRAVTSHDIEYAFERINLASLGALYGNYYCGVIKGMTCAEKSLHTVSGISTPNNTTIIFHLEKPTGDMLYRLAMPATTAFPPEVAKCFTQAGGYGRDLISSGAYMIYGEQDLNISSCSTIKNISGFNPDKGMTIVRNPNFKPDSESPDVAGNYLDGVQIAVDSNVTDIFQKVENGELDGSFSDTPPPTVEQQYATNPDLTPLIHADPGDRTWYLTMNPLTPPFDDIHVREAVQYVIDKAGIVKAYGGSLHAVPGTTVEPPTVNPATAKYDPYPSPGNAGDVTKALALMKQSKYQTNSQGMCTDPACSGFIFLGRSESPWPNMNQVAMQSLAKIGIKPKLTQVDTSTGYTTIEQMKKLIPIQMVSGWGKDFADPYGFDFFILDSAGITCTGIENYELLGMTAAIAKECGVTTEYNAALKAAGGTLPSIDAQLNSCEPKTGTARADCFAGVDKTAMETASFVPWGWANNLILLNKSTTKYQYDAFADTLSFCWMAVDNGLAPVNVAA